MSFAALIQKTWGQNILYSVILELTYDCNLDCVICYNDIERRDRALGLNQYFKLLEDLNDLGVMTVSLSGGEPLAHPDFFAIGGKARSLGFVTRIKSNGHGLHLQQLKRIKEEIDPFIIEVSLHGASAATHDRQTRVPGSFDRLMTNLAHMQSLGMRFKINVPITNWNLEEFEDMFSLILDLNVPFNFDTQITARDNGDIAPLDQCITPQAAAEFKTRLQRTLRQADKLQDYTDNGVVPSDKYCGVGSSTLAIDPFGDVLPCVQYRKPVGNLHEQSIREIWKNSLILTEVREENRAYKRQQQEQPENPLPAQFCPGIEAAKATHKIAVSSIRRPARKTGNL